MLENRMSLSESVHIPIGDLREECENKLDKSSPVITCSNTGMRCASAAFLLATLGYNAYSMQGGVLGLVKFVEKFKDTHDKN